MASPPRPAVLAGAAVLSTAPALLRRMAQELDDDGRLTATTVAWMYATYAAHAGLYGLAVTRCPHPHPPSTPVAVGGAAVAAIGTLASVAGMRRFNDLAQLSGTHPGQLVAGGIYRLSRNPQYAGYVLFLIGTAVARRSAGGLALALTAAGMFAWWVPVEERHLERVFGEPYRTYRRSTSRWAGLPQRTLRG